MLPSRLSTNMTYPLKHGHSAITLRWGKLLCCITLALAVSFTPSHAGDQSQPTVQTNKQLQKQAERAQKQAAKDAKKAAKDAQKQAKEAEKKAKKAKPPKHPVTHMLQPPPPGGSDPYPTIGLIPTTPPSVPTQQARDLLSSQLQERRNLTYRTVAQNGTLIPDLPLSPRQRKQILGNPRDPRHDFLVKDPTAPLPANLITTPPPQPKKEAIRDSRGELVLPEVEDKYSSPTQQPSPFPVDHPPDIPDGPPPVPHVKGFHPTFDSLRAENDIAPRYNLASIGGMSFHFVPQSDQLSPHEDKKLQKLVNKNPEGPFIIYGFGNTTSLQASDQAIAIKLALLRARRVAQEIMKRSGVSDKSIAIHAYAFGTGVKVVVPSHPNDNDASSNGASL